MIPWLVLLSLFCESIQDGGEGKDNGVPLCGPVDLSLSVSAQTLLLTWTDRPSCSALQGPLTYELTLLLLDNQVHNDRVPVRPGQIGSPHSWSWRAPVAPQCSSHSVRIRATSGNHSSPWTEHPLPGMGNLKEPEVFPRDQSFKVGTNATFCCVLPAGGHSPRIKLTGYEGDSNQDISMISNQSYALTVHLKRASTGSCTNVKCEMKTSDNRDSENGACAYIGYPPRDSDLQCETRNFESVECHWTVGTPLSIKRTHYQLLGSACAKGYEGSCSRELLIDVGERNWTLMAKNAFGEVELLDTADLTKRVHMFPPVEVSASTVNARNASLEWAWTVPQYKDLNVKCQVNMSHGETNTISEHSGVGLRSAVVNELIPNWTYNVMVRCGTMRHFWKWSEWSRSTDFHTRGDVPDAPDVWMQTEENRVTILWKRLLANQSHGDIIDYQVSWDDHTMLRRTTEALRLTLHRDTAQGFTVSVTARNIYGSSAPSLITIPALIPDGPTVTTSRVVGSNGGLGLSWSASPQASCGYTVDWCPTVGHCTLEWIKVPPNVTSTRIFDNNFEDGLRYSLSVYACTQQAPVLHEKKEGYIREKRIKDSLFKSMKWTQTDSSVEVSWDRVSLEEQTAFIQGYVLYCLDDKNNVVSSASTDDPVVTSLTAANLQEGSYTFKVKAKTAAGECGTSSITATLNSLTDNSINAVILSLVSVFGLLSILTVLCYRHWTCIKQKVYPPIPKPVLVNKWMTSPGENSCPPYRMDKCHHTEEDVMDVAELHCNTAALMNGYIRQTEIPDAFAQTPKGYYNQPVERCIPQALDLPTTAIRSQSELPNPSYNLAMQTTDPQSSYGPGLQEGTAVIRCSDGYQPHT